VRFNGDDWYVSDERQVCNDCFDEHYHYNDDLEEYVLNGADDCMNEDADEHEDYEDREDD
jgi:hypothetical protein